MAALACTHLEGAVPVEQLEDGHELLEFEHRAALVRLQHEAKGADARVRVICRVLAALKHTQVALVSHYRCRAGQLAPRQ